MVLYFVIVVVGIACPFFKASYSLLCLRWPCYLLQRITLVFEMVGARAYPSDETGVCKQLTEVRKGKDSVLWLQKTLL